VGVIEVQRIERFRHRIQIIEQSRRRSRPADEVCPLDRFQRASPFGEIGEAHHRLFRLSHEGHIEALFQHFAWTGGGVGASCDQPGNLAA
jgi:hypothetical protein